MLSLLSTKFNPTRLREGHSPEELWIEHKSLVDADGRCGIFPCRWVRDACAVILYIGVMMVVLVSLATAIAPR